MKLTIFTALPMTQIYGTERVFLITCNLLKENSHFPRIVALTPEDVSLPVAPALSNIAVNRYSIKLHRLSLIWVWLCMIFKFKNGIWLKAIKKDLQANGTPDIALVTDPKFIPDLIKALIDIGAKTRVFYWDHLLINFHQFLKNHDGRNIRGLGKQLYLWVYSRIFKGVLKMVDGALAISSGTKRALSFFMPEYKIPLVFNPVEMHSSKLISRSAFPTFIYVGRLEDFQKNLSFMLIGLAKLKGENLKLKILGAGPDETRLRKLSEDLGISERIEWLGYQPHPFESIGECTALLLTSRFEGLPLVLIEANAHGIPVISSNCQAGPEDIVIEGVNGYLFPEGDLEAFVNILRKVTRGELKFASPEEIARTAERFSPEAFYERLKSALGL